MYGVTSRLIRYDIRAILTFLGILFTYIKLHFLILYRLCNYGLKYFNYINIYIYIICLYIHIHNILYVYI